MIHPNPSEKKPLCCAAAETRAAAGTGILIVDDESAIRELLRDILEESGYSVSEAANGKDAVRAVEERGFDLVIIDLVMPEQEGIETIQILRETRPDLRMVAISGAAGGAYLKAASYLGAVATLQKPFTFDAVVRTVAKALDQTPPA